MSTTACAVCGRTVTVQKTGYVQRHKARPKWRYTHRLHNDPPESNPWCSGGNIWLSQ